MIRAKGMTVEHKDNDEAGTTTALFIVLNPYHNINI
jgi:hypothetical protein